MKKWILITCFAVLLASAIGAAHLPKPDNPSDFAVLSSDKKDIAVLSNGKSEAKTENKATAEQSSEQSCSTCHEEEVKSFERTSHYKIWGKQDYIKACGNCHGDKLAAHLSDNTTETAKSLKKISSMDFSQTCLKCHEKSGEQSNANLSEHTAAGVNCASCHELHPTEKHKEKMAEAGQSAMFKGKSIDLCLSCHKSVQAQFAQTTHHRLQEGVMECTNCHNPHGTANGNQLRADNKQVCIQCHQDKRGPFMYEHPASDNANGCVTCHENHGGSARNMLKMRDPKTLCMTCHSREAIGMHGVSGPQNVKGAMTTGLTSAGDCTRCHEEIHGSNSSPYFHR